MPASKSIDAYIAKFPQDIQNILSKIRKCIKQAAPNAKESMSYGVPAFKHNGILINYAAFKNHIGLYPTPSAIKRFQKELTPYKQATGTIRFQMDKPIPYDLITKIAKFRYKENSGRNK